MFREHFPYYLAIGMSEAQYWDGDCTLAVSYRRADEIRQERFNGEAWLQGMYIYEALCCVSPIIQAFPKKGTKPKPYAKEPYPIGSKKQGETTEIKKKKAVQKGRAYMEAYMAAFNAKFEQRKGSDLIADADRST